MIKWFQFSFIDRCEWVSVCMYAVFFCRFTWLAAFHNMNAYMLNLIHSEKFGKMTELRQSKPMNSTKWNWTHCVRFRLTYSVCHLALCMWQHSLQILFRQHADGAVWNDDNCLTYRDDRRYYLVITEQILLWIF